MFLAKLSPCRLEIFIIQQEHTLLVTFTNSISKFCKYFNLLANYTQFHDFHCFSFIDCPNYLTYYHPTEHMNNSYYYFSQKFSNILMCIQSTKFFNDFSVLHVEYFQIFGSTNWLLTLSVFFAL